MNITIVGAGNVGTQLAVHCANKMNKVTIYGSKPDKISKELIIVNENDEELLRGTIEKATADVAEAFSGAELVFVTMPAFCMDEVAELILPYVTENMKICIVPGTGGAECAFKKCVNKGATLFGLQRVPSVARLVEYGKKVRAIGYRDVLHVASVPCDKAVECAELISGIMDKECVAMPNYLNITLTPSNPILHTSRLKVLYGDYSEGKIYESVPLFYENWDDESSRLLLECDEELQCICRKLSKLDLSYVKSLKEHYESPTAEALTNKITSITGFKGLTSPTVKVDGGFIPDLSSRYFTADFPYGLSILVQLADLIGLDVPCMKKTLDWYYSIVEKGREFHFADYGINTIDELLEFYAR